MAKDRSDLIKGNPLPQSALDALQEFISTLSSNIVLGLSSATAVQLPAAAASGQAVLGVGGLWRYNAANAAATHPGGAAGTYDVIAVASANVFGPNDADTTDYAFGLQVVASGGGPSGNFNGRAITQYRKIGEVVWSGSAITRVRQTVPTSSLGTVHALSPFAGVPVFTGRTAAGVERVRINDDGSIDLADAAGAYTTVGVQWAAGPKLQAKGALDVLGALTQAGVALVLTSDSRLTDARTPTAHASSHRAGGTDELSHAALSAVQVKDVGMGSQLRAGRVLATADFTTLMGRTAPTGLYNLADLTDASGNGRTLSNKGAVTFGGVGIVGQTNVAIFHGGTTDALYVVDAGGNPFRLRVGAWGCWFKTAKRGTSQTLLSKAGAAGNYAFSFGINGSDNALYAWISVNGTATFQINGLIDVADDRWHFAMFSYDGTVLRLCCDGRLEDSKNVTGLIFQSTAALNIGAQAADASTNATQPMWGRIDEAFITGDALDYDDYRLLYAAKTPHGYGTMPKQFFMSVRRGKRGAPLVTGDFPSAPTRLYNFTAGALTDSGSAGTAVTDVNGTVSAAGADGAPGGGRHFDRALASYLTSTDAGLPTGVATRTIGAWIKSSFVGAMSVVAYGTGDSSMLYLAGNNGQLFYFDGTNQQGGGPILIDGQWHFVTAVVDNAAADGLKVKLYSDLRLVATGTALAATALGGAGFFRIGGRQTAGWTWDGDIDSPFVIPVALTVEQQATIMLKTALTLPPAFKNAAHHIEGVDATNVYFIGDTIEPQHTIDLGVAA